MSFLQFILPPFMIMASSFTAFVILARHLDQTLYPTNQVPNTQDEAEETPAPKPPFLRNLAAAVILAVLFACGLILLGGYEP